MIFTHNAHKVSPLDHFDPEVLVVAVKRSFLLSVNAPRCVVYDVQYFLHTLHAAVRDEVEVPLDECAYGRASLAQFDEWINDIDYKAEEDKARCEWAVKRVKKIEMREEKKTYTKALIAFAYSFGAILTSGSKQCPKPPWPMSSSAARLIQFRTSISPSPDAFRSARMPVRS